MEEDYIRLSKGDLERLIGYFGSVVVDGRQYYRDDIHIQEASGYTRECTCVFFDATADEPIYYIFYYLYDEYNDEITIRAPEDGNFESLLTYYKIRKANSRKITEYY